jgi:hypothetical protein
VAVVALRVLAHNAAKTLQQLSLSISLMRLMASPLRCTSLPMHNALRVRALVPDQARHPKRAAHVVAAAVLQTIKECFRFHSHVVYVAALVPPSSFRALPVVVQE